jgi:23S rRNA A2030 N6-methylase RlmJ
MSNAKHHGRISEVWKHLVIGEVAVLVRPDRYLETHAGSASYPAADDPERRFGVRYFRAEAGADDVLASTRYYATLVACLAAGRAGVCPGSAVVAMDALGVPAGYVLCDMDPESAETLRSAAKESGLEGRVEVVESDGMTEVARRVLGGTASSAARSLVFVDPFEPEAVGPSGLSALSLTDELIKAGVPTVYWYGYSSPKERCWAWEKLSKDKSKPIWCGDIMVRRDGDPNEEAAGDLGRASTPGTGSGVVLANVDDGVVTRLQSIALSLERLYRQTPLPDGRTGNLDVYLRSTADRA